MKMLIVDDHILFRQGLVSLFERQPHYQVVGEAATMREAVTLALKLRPDLILMDFCLPDGTGLEATERILAELPHCKIVLLTVQDDDETLFTAIRKGAAGFLLKSLPLSRLLACLEGIEKGEPAISPDMMGRLYRELAHSGCQTKVDDSALLQLSRREVQILHELTTDASNRQIAERLFLAENTVKHHVHNILEKLSLENRRQAAAFARMKGL